MVKEIHLENLIVLDDRETLGRYATHDDYDELINEDCDVYGPDGTLLIAYRKAAIESILDIDEERYQYWRWTSRQNPSIGRGNAAGREIKEHTWRRIRQGELNFVKAAIKGEMNEIDEEGAWEYIERNPEWCTQNFVVAEVKAAGLYDVSSVEKEEKMTRNFRNLPKSEVDAAVKKLIENRNIWFRNWVRDVFLPSENRVEEAKKCKRNYLGRETYNEVFSNVMGAMDRQPLLPWCRLTNCTERKYEQFEKEKPFFRQVDALFAEHMPKERQFILDVIGDLKDERYSLFGTAFSTITVNNNFQTALHRDGNNCKGGIAVLSSINKGTYDGFSFVFPEMRLAFEIHTGDFLCGDNQKYIHGQLPMENASDDAESIWFVFYTREGLKHGEDWECEQCRRSFMRWSAENLKEKGTGRKTWNGIYPKMWHSPEWLQFKKDHGMDRCTATTVHGTFPS